MSLQVCVLASGSSGNSVLIRTPAGAVLLDAGLHPDDLEARLAAVGSGPEELQAVLVSHLHGDHVHPKATRWWWCKKGGRRVWCHSRHAEPLRIRRAFRLLSDNGDVRFFDAGGEIPLAPDLTFRPLPLSHDADPTFGFRFTYAAGTDEMLRAAFVCDAGGVDEGLIPLLAESDLLGLEFNHDPRMLAESGRPRGVIDRIRGPRGHLSNAKGAAVLERVLSAADGGGPTAVLLLHLSRECNRADLALAAAERVMVRRGNGALVAAARQETPDRLRTVEARPRQRMLFEI
jgi:phosphoribosyl 1,2-cyclic phosphodiesterase